MTAKKSIALVKMEHYETFSHVGVIDVKYLPHAVLIETEKSTHLYAMRNIDWVEIREVES